MKDPAYYRPVEYDSEESGGLHFVEDIATAKQAIDTVIHQGEGFTMNSTPISSTRR